MRRRFQVAKLSRRARKGEEFISGYAFPADVERRTRDKFPQLDDGGWARVEEGLREWLVCCAWRGYRLLGMPSRAVDEAWREFILDALAYTEFCEQAFGAYLPHLPDETPTAPLDDVFANSVAAWDRSVQGRGVRESVLWDLDRHLGIDDPWGLDDEQLALVRKRISDEPPSEWIWPAESYWVWGGTN
jgi:hypothetical protein